MIGAGFLPDYKQPQRTSAGCDIIRFVFSQAGNINGDYTGVGSAKTGQSGLGGSNGFAGKALTGIGSMPTFRVCVSLRDHKTNERSLP